eukprot:Ihof_evm1s36 gene=Ihof_evmTU1s36
MARMGKKASKASPSKVIVKQQEAKSPEVVVKQDKTQSRKTVANKKKSDTKTPRVVVKREGYTSPVSPTRKARGAIKKEKEIEKEIEMVSRKRNADALNVENSESKHIKLMETTYTGESGLNVREPCPVTVKKSLASPIRRNRGGRMAESSYVAPKALSTMVHLIEEEGPTYTQDFVVETIQKAAKKTVEKDAENSVQETVNETVLEAVESSLDEVIQETSMETGHEAVKNNAQEKVQEIAMEAAHITTIAHEVVVEAPTDSVQEKVQEAVEKRVMESTQETTQKALMKTAMEGELDKVHEAMKESLQEIVEKTALHMGQENAQDAVEAVVVEATPETVQKTVKERVHEKIHEIARETAQITTTVHEVVVGVPTDNVLKVQEAVEKVEMETTQKTVMHTAMESVQEKIHETAMQTTRETVMETTQETVKDRVQETAMEATQGTVQERVQETAMETTPMAVDEAVVETTTNNVQENNAQEHNVQENNMPENNIQEVVERVPKAVDVDSDVVSARECIQEQDPTKAINLDVNVDVIQKVSSVVATPSPVVKVLTDQVTSLVKEIKEIKMTQNRERERVATELERYRAKVEENKKFLFNVLKKTQRIIGKQHISQNENDVVQYTINEFLSLRESDWNVDDVPKIGYILPEEPNDPPEKRGHEELQTEVVISSCDVTAGPTTTATTTTEESAITMATRDNNKKLKPFTLPNCSLPILLSKIDRKEEIKTAAEKVSTVALSAASLLNSQWELSEGDRERKMKAAAKNVVQIPVTQFGLVGETESKVAPRCPTSVLSPLFGLSNIDGEKKKKAADKNVVQIPVTRFGLVGDAKSKVAPSCPISLLDPITPAQATQTNVKQEATVTEIQGTNEGDHRPSIFGNPISTDTCDVIDQPLATASQSDTASPCCNGPVLHMDITSQDTSMTENRTTIPTKPPNRFQRVKRHSRPHPYFDNVPLWDRDHTSNDNKEKRRKATDAVNNVVDVPLAQFESAGEFGSESDSMVATSSPAQVGAEAEVNMSTVSTLNPLSPIPSAAQTDAIEEVTEIQGTNEVAHESFIFICGKPISIDTLNDKEDVDDTRLLPATATKSDPAIINKTTQNECEMQGTNEADCRVAVIGNPPISTVTWHVIEEPLAAATESDDAISNGPIQNECDIQGANKADCKPSICGSPISTDTCDVIGQLPTTVTESDATIINEPTHNECEMQATNEANCGPYICGNPAISTDVSHAFVQLQAAATKAHDAFINEPIQNKCEVQGTNKADCKPSICGNPISTDACVVIGQPLAAATKSNATIMNVPTQNECEKQGTNKADCEPTTCVNPIFTDTCDVIGQPLATTTESDAAIVNEAAQNECEMQGTNEADCQPSICDNPISTDTCDVIEQPPTIASESDAAILNVPAQNEYEMQATDEAHCGPSICGNPIISTDICHAIGQPLAAATESDTAILNEPTHNGCEMQGTNGAECGPSICGNPTISTDICHAIGQPLAAATESDTAILNEATHNECEMQGANGADCGPSICGNSTISTDISHALGQLLSAATKAHDALINEAIQNECEMQGTSKANCEPSICGNPISTGTCDVIGQPLATATESDTAILNEPTQNECKMQGTNKANCEPSICSNPISTGTCGVIGQPLAMATESDAAIMNVPIQNECEMQGTNKANCEPSICDNTISTGTCDVTGQPLATTAESDAAIINVPTQNEREMQGTNETGPVFALPSDVPISTFSNIATTGPKPTWTKKPWSIHKVFFSDYRDKKVEEEEEVVMEEEEEEKDEEDPPFFTKPKMLFTTPAQLQVMSQLQPDNTIMEKIEVILPNLPSLENSVEAAKAKAGVVPIPSPVDSSAAKDQAAVQPNIDDQPNVAAQSNSTAQPNVDAQPSGDAQPSVTARPNVAAQSNVDPTRVPFDFAAAQDRFAAQSNVGSTRAPFNFAAAQDQVAGQPNVVTQPNVIAQPNAGPTRVLFNFTAAQDQAAAQPNVVAQPNVGPTRVPFNFAAAQERLAAQANVGPTRVPFNFGGTPSELAAMTQAAAKTAAQEALDYLNYVNLLKKGAPGTVPGPHPKCHKCGNLAAVDLLTDKALCRACNEKIVKEKLSKKPADFNPFCAKLRVLQNPNKKPKPNSWIRPSVLADLSHVRKASYIPPAQPQPQPIHPAFAACYAPIARPNFIPPLASPPVATSVNQPGALVQPASCWAPFNQPNFILPPAPASAATPVGQPGDPARPVWVPEFIMPIFDSNGRITTARASAILAARKEYDLYADIPFAEYKRLHGLPPSKYSNRCLSFSTMCERLGFKEPFSRPADSTIFLNLKATAFPVDLNAELYVNPDLKIPTRNSLLNLKLPIIMYCPGTDTPMKKFEDDEEDHEELVQMYESMVVGKRPTHLYPVRPMTPPPPPPTPPPPPPAEELVPANPFTSIDRYDPGPVRRLGIAASCVSIPPHQLNGDGCITRNVYLASEVSETGTRRYYRVNKQYFGLERKKNAPYYTMVGPPTPPPATDDSKK